MKADRLRVVLLVGIAHAAVTVLGARSANVDAKRGMWRGFNMYRRNVAAESSQSKVFDQMMADITSLEPYIDRQIERKLNVSGDSGSGYSSYLRCVTDSQRKITARRKAYATVFKICVEDSNRRALEAIQVAKERVASPSADEPHAMEAVPGPTIACSQPSCKGGATATARNLYGAFDVNADFQLSKARLAVDVNDSGVDSCMDGISKAESYLQSYQKFLRDMCSSLKGGNSSTGRSADYLPPSLLEL